MAIGGVALRGSRHWWGNGPEQAYECTGAGHDDLVGVLAAGHELTIALAQPYLGPPTDGLDGLRELFQPEWPGAADLGGIAGGPGAFNQATPRRGIASCGQCSLPPALTAGIF